MYKFTFVTLLCLLSVGTFGQNITSFAGSNIHTFFNGASGTNGQLAGPWGITITQAGMIYVADRDNDAIRRVNAATGTMTTLAGCGIRGYAGDGYGATAARLNSPYCIAADAAGNVFIADAGNNCIRKVDPSGIITTYAGTGTAGYSGDSGPATLAKLNGPVGVFLDASGNLYVADALNNVVRKITSAGIISTIAGTGTRGYTGDGLAATLATLRYPNTVGMDYHGNIYIIDSGNSCIRKIDNSGIIRTIAGTGSRGWGGDGGPATAALLDGPIGLATDSDLVYFCDGNNNRIRVIDNAGIINTVAGNGTIGHYGDGGAATSAQLNNPWGVTIDTSGNLYVADGYNNSIRKINTSGIISTIGGNYGFNGDGGAATSASLHTPVDVAYDDANNVVIADAGSHRVRVVNAAGIITTVAGKDSVGNSGDGGLAINAKMIAPVSVVTDRAGNIFVADQTANCIRRIDHATGIITRFAGTSVAGFAGDGSPATSAQLNGPVGLAIDNSGNVYISDKVNNRIRKIDIATGIITTYAGNGVAAFSGDGSAASSASLNGPMYIDFDKSNNLFIADMNNNRVRMVDGATAVISTVFGNGMVGDGGDGGVGTSAQLCSPIGIAVDSFGGVSVTTCGKIRHLPGGGRPPIRLDAGSSFSGMTPDGTPANASVFRSLMGIAYDRNYNLIIADGGSRTVSTSSSPFGVGVKEVLSTQANIRIYPNPNTGSFELICPVGNIDASEQVDAVVSNVLGREIYREHVNIVNGYAYLKVDLGQALPDGVYFCRLAGVNGQFAVRLLVQH